MDRLILVLASVSSPCCNAPCVSGCSPRCEIRCSACGHRTPRGGMAPKRSRSLPPWTWPGEFLGRAQARRAIESTLSKVRP